MKKRAALFVASAHDELHVAAGLVAAGLGTNSAPYKVLKREIENHEMGGDPLLEAARVGLGLFVTYCMQDMTWDRLEKDIGREACDELRERHALLVAAIARAEGKESP